MTHVILVLADATIKAPLGLFASRPSCVVMAMHNSFPQEEELVIPLPELTRSDFDALICVLEGRLIDSCLSPDLLAKAAKYCFVNDVVHYALEDEKQKLSEKAWRLDAFLHGGDSNGDYTNDLLLLSKAKYQSLKFLPLPANIVPVAILVDYQGETIGIVAYDVVPLKVRHREAVKLLEDFDLNDLKHQLCFEIYQGSPDPHPDVPLKLNSSLDVLKNLGALDEDRNSATGYCDLVASAVYSSDPEEFLQGMSLAAAMLDTFTKDPQTITRGFSLGISIYHRSYESYCKELTPAIFAGRIEAARICKVVAKNKELLSQEAAKRHSKAQIISALSPVDGVENHLVVYGVCYGLVRIA